MRTATFFYSLITTSVLLILAPQPIFAQNVVFEDNFLNGLAKWQPVRDDGRYWKITNDALEAYIPFRSIITELVPINSMWNPAVKNIELSMKFFPIEGGDKNISFGYIDAKNWYELHFTNTYTEIVKIKNGTTAWSTQKGAVLPNGITYDLRLRFINGEISFFVNNQQLFSVTDPTFINEFGKIGLKASTGSIFPTRIIFDDVVIRNLDLPSDFSLNIPLLLQGDPAWAELEYDTASHWIGSNTNISDTFKDWACNLISQVMLLKYHGITKLPDGAALTPISLNTWLLENNGYIDSPRTGNINRLSISKLSKLMSDVLHTPKLEYTYVKDNMIATAIAEIEKGNPVLLQLDGHFVVADGYTADKTDLLIKDPAYNIQRLSQHPLPLLSVRLYTPSNTDLSYLSVHTDPNTTISVLNSQGSQIPANTYEEYLKPASGESSSPHTKIIEIAKPATSELSLAVSSSSQSQVEVISTTESGETQELLNSDNLPAGLHTYHLVYEKNGTSELDEVLPTPTPTALPSPNPTPSPVPSPTATPVPTPQPPAGQPTADLSTLKKLVTTLYIKKEIKTAQFKQILLNMVNSVEKISQKKNQVKLLKVLEIIIFTAPKIFITSSGKVELLHELASVIKNLR